MAISSQWAIGMQLLTRGCAYYLQAAGSANSKSIELYLDLLLDLGKKLAAQASQFVGLPEDDRSHWLSLVESRFDQLEGVFHNLEL